MYDTSPTTEVWEALQATLRKLLIPGGRVARKLKSSKKRCRPNMEDGLPGRVRDTWLVTAI